MISRTNVLVLLLSGLATLTICTITKTKVPQAPQGRTYENKNYGYSLTIPTGLIEINDPPPTPQHGIKISLSEDAIELIWADGSYNAALWRTLKDATEAHLKWLAEDMRKVILLRQDNVDLGPLKALRIVVQYEDPATRRAMIEDFLLAMRDVKGEVGIVYTIGLRTQRNDYDKQKGLLDKAISGWDLRPIE